MKGKIKKIEKLTAKSGKIYYKVEVNNEVLLCFDKAVEGLDGKTIEYEINEKKEGSKVTKFLQAARIVEGEPEPVEEPEPTKEKKELDEKMQSMLLSYAKDLTVALIPVHKLNLDDVVTTIEAIYSKLTEIINS